MGASNLGMDDTELKLGLPGAGRAEGERKRVFLEAAVDLRLGSSGGENVKIDGGGAEKPPVAKAQLVGWPPVRPCRRYAMKSSKFVKVAVDGAPYLRKVDLETYNSYEQLLNALEKMLLHYSNYLNERSLVDVNGTEFVPTYEDKDGDWMMVGDVPWKMFVDSCKKLRLMKSLEAINPAPGTPASSTNAK